MHRCYAQFMRIIVVFFFGCNAYIQAENSSVEYLLLARTSVHTYKKCDVTTIHEKGAYYRWVIDAPKHLRVWLFSYSKDEGYTVLISPETKKPELRMYGRDAFLYPFDGTWFIPDATVQFTLVLSPQTQFDLEKAILTVNQQGIKTELRKLMSKTSLLNRPPLMPSTISGSFRNTYESIEFNSIPSDSLGMVVYEIIKN
jgi:hypothetical protein